MLQFVLIAIIICEITGLAYRKLSSLIKSFIFYTQLSNLAALISALLLLIQPQAQWVHVFRYVSVCMLIMTMLVTVFVLVPTMKDTKLLLWSRVGFFLHLVCPVLNTASYVFLEPHAPASMIMVPTAVTLLYGIIMIYLNYIRKVDGPYPFLRVHHQSVKATVLWIAALFVLVSLIGSAVWFVSSPF